LTLSCDGINIVIDIIGLLNTSIYENFKPNLQGFFLATDYSIDFRIFLVPDYDYGIDFLNTSISVILNPTFKMGLFFLVTDLINIDFLICKTSNYGNP
jgi:hypothetical protein